MRKPTPPINRDLGTKKACIAELRGAINRATILLDGGSLYTALFTLELAICEVQKKMPREKVIKPFKH